MYTYKKQTHTPSLTNQPTPPTTGASGDSETSGPQPADEGFLSFLRSFLFPNPTDTTAAAPTVGAGGRFAFVSAMAARVGAQVSAAVRKGGDAGEGAGAEGATAITIAPSPGKGEKGKKGKNSGKEKEGEVGYLVC